MKKLQASFRIFMTITAALGWWGVIFPELSMTPDTYRIVYEDNAIQPGEELLRDASRKKEWNLDYNIYETILSADPDCIRFRSRLFMNLTALSERERGINESRK